MGNRGSKKDKKKADPSQGSAGQGVMLDMRGTRDTHGQASVIASEQRNQQQREREAAKRRSEQVERQMNKNHALNYAASRPQSERSRQEVRSAMANGTKITKQRQGNPFEIEDREIRGDLDIKDGVIEVLNKYDIDELPRAISFANMCKTAGYKKFSHLKLAPADRL